MTAHEQGPACAHMVLRYAPIFLVDGGRQSRWLCKDCFGDFMVTPLATPASSPPPSTGDAAPTPVRFDPETTPRGHCCECDRDMANVNATYVDALRAWRCYPDCYAALLVSPIAEAGGGRVGEETPRVSDEEVEKICRDMSRWDELRGTPNQRDVHFLAEQVQRFALDLRVARTALSTAREEADQQRMVNVELHVALSTARARIAELEAMDAEVRVILGNPHEDLTTAEGATVIGRGLEWMTADLLDTQKQLAVAIREKDEARAQAIRECAELVGVEADEVSRMTRVNRPDPVHALRAVGRTILAALTPPSDASAT